MHDAYAEEDDREDDAASAQEAQSYRQKLALPASGAASGRSWLLDRLLASGGLSAPDCCCIHTWNTWHS